MAGLFDNYGFESAGIFNVSPREAFELSGKGAIIIDVREENLRGFKSFDVPRLMNLPKTRIEEEYESLPFDRYLIFADTVGLRSREVVISLKEKGFERIANMAGGIVDWERDGLPVTCDNSKRLTGSCMCQLKPRENQKKSGAARSHRSKKI